MTQIPHLVQLISNNCISWSLHHVQISPWSQIASSQKPFKSATHRASLLNDLLQVLNISYLNSISFPSIPQNLRPNRQLELITDPFHQHLLVEMTRQHHVLVSHWVHVISLAFPRHHWIKLPNHDDQTVKLMLKLTQMHANMILQENLPSLSITHFLSNPCQNRPKPRPYERLALLRRV